MKTLIKGFIIHLIFRVKISFVKAKTTLAFDIAAFNSPFPQI